MGLLYHKNDIPHCTLHGPLAHNRIENGKLACGCTVFRGPGLMATIRPVDRRPARLPGAHKPYAK